MVAFEGNWLFLHVLGLISGLVKELSRKCAVRPFVTPLSFDYTFYTIQAGLDDPSGAFTWIPQKEVVGSSLTN